MCALSCALFLRAKCATRSGPDGSLLVLKRVSIADDFGMVFDTLTIVDGARVLYFVFISQRSIFFALMV
jgi:hypothetical protein